MRQVVIIGGGLAGLTSALNLCKAGISVTVIEKKAYPFHRVCGEYISNEVLPYLHQLGAELTHLSPAHINEFVLSSPKGNFLKSPLDLGGFGISRYTLDNYLHQFAMRQGVEFILQTAVQEVNFNDNHFSLHLSNGEHITSEIALGAYGKRTALDRQLNRQFFVKRSPYVGIKYHLHYDQPANQIALHNFEDGYAGISAIEDGRYCFCYLTTRQNLQKHGNIQNLEHAILCQNPYLRRIFKEADFLYTKPEVINEISFATKTCVEQHMLMCGDAAGMIAPLCGNGMAMAIHAGKLAADQVKLYFANGQNRQQLEQGYTTAWQKQFDNRLRLGRTVQHLFGNTILSEIAVATLKRMPAVLQHIMALTHGQPF